MSLFYFLWSIIWELFVVLLETSAVLSYEPVSSLLSFRGIIGHFRGIIICVVIFFLKLPRYYHMSRYPLFKLPWYYRTLPRYYHMCRYLLSYASAVLSHVPISSLFGFRSNKSIIWNHVELIFVFCKISE